MPKLSSARYGKDNVRVYKVHRDLDTGVQTVTEMTVCVLLEGEIETSYTEADNGVVVPTDTMKQTTYIIAKQHPVNPPELFASILASHFTTTYSHIHTATVSVVQHRWTRITIDGKPHPHSFYRDGDEKRCAEAVAHKKGSIDVTSSISGLLVLKSTGSAFHGFNTEDEYTILKPTDDRILSTNVDSAWAWKTFEGGAKDVEEAKGKIDAAYEAARSITLRIFANDSSPSVQNTMWKMSQEILDTEALVDRVDYSLPNKHYFEIDLSWHKGLKNTGKDAEVYQPQTDPNGLIQCSVSR